MADVPATAFGLGIAFGPGDSVFGTANGQPLVHVAFNPVAGTATLSRNYAATLVPTVVSIIGVQASSNLLAGVALETPDNVVLYDLADIDNPVLLDQRLIPPEQPNVNGTGSMDFGGNRLFVLDTNNGLRAYEIKRGGAAGPATLGAAQVVGGTFSFTLTGTPGREYGVQKSPDLRVWTEIGTYPSPATVSDATGAGAAFYRAVAK